MTIIFTESTIIFTIVAVEAISASSYIKYLFKAKKNWAIVFLVASFVPVLFWGRLEGVEIPRHFNGTGEVDATGGRFFLVLPEICSLVMCLLFRLWERYCLKHSTSDSNTTLNLWLGRWVKAIALLLVAYFGNISLAIALGWVQGWSSLSCRS